MKAQLSLPALFLALVVMGSIALFSYAPNDGFTSITGRDVFIAAVPEVNNVFVNSTLGTNTANENLTVYWNSTDDDNDKIINITDWRTNDSSFIIFNMPFEANGGSNSTDYSKFGKNGTVSNGPVWNKTGGFAGSGAYHFDGANDRIQLTPTALAVPVTNRSTISMWIHPITGGCSSDYGTLFTQGASIGLWYKCSTGNIDFFYSSSDHESTISVPVNEWHHVVGKNDDGNFTFYIDGVSAGTFEFAPRYRANNIGSDPGEPYKGFIDELRVYNRTLSEAQILAIYNNRTDLIVSEETELGDNWTACITPNDGNQDGATVCSNGLVIVETTPPVISNVIDFVSDESAIIRWTTDESANSSVNYGITTALGTKIGSASLVTSHDLTLSSLENNTLYFYNVTSCDIFANCNVSGGFNLTTAQNVNEPVVISVRLNTTPINNNKTNNNMTVYFNVTDADSDPIRNITDWRLNGVSIAKVTMPFENSFFSGILAKDYSTFGNDGIVVGANFTPNGFRGGAYSFDGVNDYINLSTIINSSKVTYGGWVNFNTLDCPSSPAPQYCIPFHQDNLTFAGFELYVDTASGNVFCYDGSTTAGGVAISAGIWYHLLCLHDGALFYLYINGVQQGATGASSATPPAFDFIIGGGGTFGINFFNGTIDEVFVYNRNLSQQQILAIVNNRTDLLVSQELNKTPGENWSVAVTPNDGTVDGATVISNTITTLEPNAPLIQSIQYLIDNESVFINWTTNEISNTSVNYGTTISLGTIESKTENVTSHNITITGLTDNTTYYFNVTSCDVLGNCATNRSTAFFTLPNQGCINPTSIPNNSITQVREIRYTRDILFCSGNYNVAGMSAKVHLVDLICNNTVFNSTGGGSTGISISSLNNITMGGCTFRNFGTAANIVRTGFVDSNNIRLDNNTFISNTLAINIFGGTTFNLNNNFINCSGNNGIRFDVDDTSDFIIVDNTVINCAEGIKTTCGTFGSCTGTNQITIANNTLASNTVGIVTSANSAPGVQGGTISGNNFSNSQYGIYMPSGGSGLILTRNMFANSSASDVFWSQLNTLILNAGDNEISISNTVLNMTSQGNNVFIGPKIVAINTTAEPGLNLSANLKFVDLTSTATPDVYMFSGFSNDSAFVIANGIICPAAICTSQNYSTSAGILNVTVTGFSSYAVKENFVAAGGGGGGGSVSPAPSSAVQPPSLPSAPVLQAPSLPQITNFACLESASIKRTANETSLLDYLKKIKKGYEVVIPPFNLDCKNASAQLTLAVPDKYSNLTAIRCAGSNCDLVEIAQTREVRCAQSIFPDILRTSTILSPESFPIELTPTESSPGENELESINTKIKFIGNVEGKVLLNKLFGPAKEPTNQRIRIVGTPTLLTFEGNVDGPTNITLPYVVPPYVDELSTAIFAYKNNQWAYLGGNVDIKTKTVTTTVDDISKYVEDNKLLVAPLGLICLNCIDAKFEKVYGGYTRNAVVLIHGFENTPERFEDIINDIKLTNQPWQAWVFGYPSNKPIEENAKIFADLLQSHANEYDTIYIAAHSLGGLVAQEALNYAYEQNKDKLVKPYTFITKVVKVTSVATPNKGILTQDPTNLFNYLVNNDALSGLFNLNSGVIKELISGKEIPRVPGIEYLVIAGTLPYEFSDIFGINEKNDGLVTLDSAQTIGGELVNNYCSNFWTINSTHTDILNNYDSRKIVERIVARQIAEGLPNKPVLGFNDYYNLNVRSCNSNDQYVVVGIPLEEEAQPNPGLCSCGNNVCGVDENEVNCPSDCARIEMPEAGLFSLFLRFAPLRNLLIILILIIIAVILLSRRKKHPVSTRTMQMKAMLPKELPKDASDSKRANQLDELIVQTRVNIRLRNYDKATLYYSRFNSEYSAASLNIKEKFKEDFEKLKKEAKERLK